MTDNFGLLFIQCRRYSLAQPRKQEKKDNAAALGNDLCKEESISDCSSV